MLPGVDSLLHWLSQHWGDVVPTWLAVILAAVFGVQSWRSSRQSRSARDAAQAAEARAEAQVERAIKAAEDAAAAADRSATAQEAHTALLQDAADGEERFPWRIDRMGKSMDFRLVNMTKTRKYRVIVTGEPTGQPAGVFRPGGGGDNCFDAVDGRETVELDLFVAMQTVDRSVTVCWHPTPDHTGEAWTQRIGLP